MKVVTNWIRVDFLICNVAKNTQFWKTMSRCPTDPSSASELIAIISAVIAPLNLQVASVPGLQPVHITRSKCFDVITVAVHCVETKSKIIDRFTLCNTEVSHETI